MKYKLTLLLSLLFILSPSISIAQGFTGERVSDLVSKNLKVDLETNAKLITEIEDYLSNFITMEARFTQTANNKMQIRQGKLLISRPGKARWEYHTPVKTALTIRNGNMSYYDTKLKQMTYGTIPNSPLQILLHKEVKLSGEVKIIDIKQTYNSASIIIAPNIDENKFETLEMVFTQNPLELKRLHRTDTNNHRTALTLKNIVFNVPLSDELFSMSNPNAISRKKN